MSQEEKDAILGSLIREFKENTVELGAVRAKAAKMADGLDKIDEVLLLHVEYLVFEGEYVDEMFSVRTKKTYREGALDVAELKKVAASARDLIKRNHDIAERLAAMGHDPRPQSPRY